GAGTRAAHGPGGRPGAERPEEAAAATRVTRAPALLLDDEEQHVHVAVVPRVAHVLAVAGRLALAPVLSPTPAPEPGAPGLQGALERLAVHPGDHQHLVGAVL